MTLPLRNLSLLLCLLIAGPMSTPAWALARPETRAGKIFLDSPKSAAADLDQTLEPHRESRGCGYDFASGVCKYLYVHGNPVNGVDPSGHEFTIAGTMSAVGNGFWIATRVGSTAYAAYSIVEWLRDGVELLSATVATGTVDPVALGFWASDFIPIGKVAGKIGRVTGIGKHLAQVRGALQGIGNRAKEQLGLLAANAVARAKGFRPTNFTPRGNGGFDGLFKDGDHFVVMESKFGLNPHLNPGTVTNPNQMSQAWIEKNIRDLEQYDADLANELRKAVKDKRVKGMVVKTKVGANGEILDPEFELKDWGEIGVDTW